MPTNNPLNVMQPNGPYVSGPAVADSATAPLANGTTTQTPASQNSTSPAVAQTSVTNANMTTASQPAAGLVANNVASLIDQNSPLMQRAAAKAAEQSNARGMLNSSMAVGDAQNAVIANATPIAQSDAASTNQFALTNAQAANTNSQFNAGQANTVGTSNTTALNNAGNLKSQQDAQAALQTQQIDATAAQNTQQQQSNAVQQANQLLQQAASTHDQQVAAIMADQTMSTEAKNAAIATLNANYLSFQQSYQALSGLTGVTQLLDFGATGSPAVAGAGATPGSNAAAYGAGAAAAGENNQSAGGTLYSSATGTPVNAAAWDTLAKPIQDQMANTPQTIQKPDPNSDSPWMTITVPNPAYAQLQQQLGALGPRPAA